MPTKKKSSRLVIQSLGLLQLVHPDSVRETWQGTISFGTKNINLYNWSINDNQGVIRMSVAGKERLAALKDSARTVDTYQIDDFIESEVSIKESVVASTICKNPDYSEILEGKKSDS